jgi:hypothetical protein
MTVDDEVVRILNPGDDASFVQFSNGRAGLAATWPMSPKGRARAPNPAIHTPRPRESGATGCAAISSHAVRFDEHRPGARSHAALDANRFTLLLKPKLTDTHHDVCPWSIP